MIENIRLSFQGIWAHKMRSFLTMLGIIIGIASIISIVSTIKGTNEQIKQQLDRRGEQRGAGAALSARITDCVYDGGQRRHAPGHLPRWTRTTSTRRFWTCPRWRTPRCLHPPPWTTTTPCYYGNRGASAGCEILGVDNAYFRHLPATPWTGAAPVRPRGLSRVPPGGHRRQRHRRAPLPGGGPRRQDHRVQLHRPGGRRAWWRRHNQL